MTDIPAPTLADLEALRDTIAEATGMPARLLMPDDDSERAQLERRRQAAGIWSSTPGSLNYLDPVTRQAVLSRLDVEPWRVPAGGLLEYDPAHDEWRIEVYSPDRMSVRIVRRHAGRQRAWSDLSPYIADQGVRAWFRPNTPADGPPSMRDLGCARGGIIRRPRDDAGDQVDAMAYAVSSLVPGVTIVTNAPSADIRSPRPAHRLAEQIYRQAMRRGRA